ncbi:MAG: hypothetical protein EOP06_19780 [Proteobacteria bacterium]|nr:MAG: hypothetical protein EOP06_19780 [Pseudomonadota bacterium]
MPVDFLPHEASDAKAARISRSTAPAFVPTNLKLPHGFRAVRHDGETQLGLTDGSAEHLHDSIAYR